MPGEGKEEEGDDDDVESGCRGAPDRPSEAGSGRRRARQTDRDPDPSFAGTVPRVSKKRMIFPAASTGYTAAEEAVLKCYGNVIFPALSACPRRTRRTARPRLAADLKIRTEPPPFVW